jgi:hypothetical protein
LAVALVLVPLALKITVIVELLCATGGGILFMRLQAIWGLVQAWLIQYTELTMMGTTNPQTANGPHITNNA